MSAFNGSGEPGMSGAPDLDDILEQMFGMGGMGGMGGMPGGGPRRPKPRRSPNEEQKYEVTLEDLYKGKTVRFASTKNILCSLCKGKGGKEKATPKTCSTCNGQGMYYIGLVRPCDFLLIKSLFSRVQGNCHPYGSVPHTVSGPMLNLQGPRQLLQPQRQMQEMQG